MTNFRNAGLRAPAYTGWMTRFEALVVERMPEQAGRIEWVDAVYLHQIDKSPLEAAVQYVANRTQGV